VVDGHSSARLEQGLARVVDEEVSVDLVAVVAPGTARRKSADEEAWSGGKARLVAVVEDVVPDGRDLRLGGHSRPVGRARRLPLDLHAVPAAAQEGVVLDQSADEGITAVRIPEVRAEPGAVEDVATQHPAPRGGLRGDRVVVVRAAEADERAVLHRDVMNDVARPAATRAGRPGADAECAVDVAPVEGDRAEDDVA